MEIIPPDTEFGSDIDRSVGASAGNGKPFDLQRYSLNAVVSRNKSLWCPPQKWTQVHLQALCVHLQRDAGVEDIPQDGSQRFLRALIPDHQEDHLERFINTMTKRVGSNQRAVALDAMLVFLKPAQMHVHNDTGADIDSKPHLDIDAVPFSHFFEYSMELAVGRRTYRLPPLYKSRLGPLLLYYLDSGHIGNSPYEPCIAAVLIAIAQTNSSSTDKLPVKVSR